MMRARRRGMVCRCPNTTIGAFIGTMLPLVFLCTMMPIPAFATEATVGESDIIAPRVTVDFGHNAFSGAVGRVAYTNRGTSAELSITDRHLDKAATTVNGSPLVELLYRGAGAPDPGDPRVSYAAWEVRANADGTVTYHTTMYLEDGAYNLPFVHATDDCGNHAADEHELDGRCVSGIVVDTVAPKVRGTLDRKPAFELVGEGGIAFLDARTSLVLSLEDETSGIAQVEGQGLGRLSVVTSDDRTSARIELAQGTLSCKASIVVSDYANNQYVWSLRDEGLSRVGGVETPVPNEPLSTLYEGELVCGEGHPRMLVVDTQAPVLRFGKEPAEGAVLRDGQVLTLKVRDANWGRLALLDPCQEIARVTRDGVPLLSQEVGSDIKPTDKTHEYEMRFAADKVTHADDGRYEVEARLRDLSGNVATARRSFVIDTTPPVLDVDFGTGSSLAPSAVRCFGGSRAVRVSVVDRGLDAEVLNAGKLVSVVASACHGRKGSEVEVGPWQSGAMSDEFFCEVRFPEDGEYTLEVHGTDVAGNPLVGSDGTQVDERGRYASGSFVVDATSPRASLVYAKDSPAGRRFGGKDYFRTSVSLVATVTDRNLDVSRTTVTDSMGNDVVPEWTVSERSKNGEVTYTATIPYREESTGADAGSKHPVLRAYDLAGNAATPVSLDFVVDQTAPYVDAATMSKRASAVGRDARAADPHRFYNERDGVLTQLSFTVCDEHLVDGLWVDDPDDAYDVTAPNVRGLERVGVTLSLKDHDTQGAGHDTDFERNVRLFVRDVAGNMRTWTIDRTGTIDAERSSDRTNASLDDEGVYPMALVKDTTAPVIRVSGIKPGSYHNTTQVERVLVEEYNFDYLKRFRPQRPVVTIQKRAGDATGNRNTRYVVASEFEGTRPSYAYDCVFEADGHYSLVASLDDMADNPSGKVHLAEFTIDKTPPRIHVSWDNEDVRNIRGGVDFYNAPRTATVVVEEHNFDPALFDVQTHAGKVGSWETSGDMHTCVVRFDTDAPSTAPHGLKVLGRDLAGNEAEPYVASAFAIDTVSPRVSFCKRVSDGDLFGLGEQESELEDGTAFAAGIMPIVVLEDDADFCADGMRVRMTGRRDPSNVWEATTVGASANGVRMDWGNLGLSDGPDGMAYRLEADDVYTIEAEAVDMAGNTSGKQSVTFSVNRFGSNFFFEGIEGHHQRVDGSWDDVLLQSPPRIIVHEVNVCGTPGDAESGAGDTFHSVTKQYEHVPSVIRRTTTARRDGYTLTSSTEATKTSPYEGWTEYVYTIQSGNFGEGSSSDYGDGGQGVYRVDVSSRDKANHHNTTASFFATPATRAGDKSGDDGVPQGKTATVEFTLDEFGPTVEDVDVPGAIAVGDRYQASFRLVDQITRGDRVEVLVDGQPVEVFREGAPEPVGKDELVQPGTFSFVMDPKPITCEREVVIRAWDYTGDAKRSQTVRRTGMHLTTFFTEFLVVLGVGIVVAFARLALRRLRS